MPSHLLVTRTLNIYLQDDMNAKMQKSQMHQMIYTKDRNHLLGDTDKTFKVQLMQQNVIVQLKSVYIRSHQIGVSTDSLIHICPQITAWPIWLEPGMEGSMNLEPLKTTVGTKIYAMEATNYLDSWQKIGVQSSVMPNCQPPTLKQHIYPTILSICCFVVLFLCLPIWCLQFVYCWKWTNMLRCLFLCSVDSFNAI
jgi:hypothetical protein